MHILLPVLVTGCGAFIGGVFRYLAALIAGKFVYSYSANPNQILPFALIVTTILINISGSFCITLLTGVLQNTFNTSPLLKFFLITGVLGGFTTFSTFSLDFIYLLEHKFLFAAFLYVTISVVFALAGAMLGFKLAAVLK